MDVPRNLKVNLHDVLVFVFVFVPNLFGEVYWLTHHGISEGLRGFFLATMGRGA